MTWAEGPNVLVLPSGRRVRGRGVREPLPPGPLPEYSVHLGVHEDVPWPVRHVAWRDFWLPSRPAELRSVLVDVLERSSTERIEFSCIAGQGRTGTALACLAILDGLPARDALGYVREHYRPTAVDTPWQAWFIRRFH